MERRDLAWITDPNGEIVAVAVVRIDPVSCRVEVEGDVSVADGYSLHIPGVTPALAP